MTEIKTSRFDVSEYLTDETLIHAYLNEVLIEDASSEMIQAMNDVIRARDMNYLTE